MAAPTRGTLPGERREKANGADALCLGPAAVWRPTSDMIGSTAGCQIEGTVVNKGAADWIYRNDDLLEPWVYLIDAKGRIAERWDNVATRGEIEPVLEGLPKL